MQEKVAELTSMPRESDKTKQKTYTFIWSFEAECLCTLCISIWFRALKNRLARKITWKSKKYYIKLLLQNFIFVVMLDKVVAVKRKCEDCVTVICIIPYILQHYPKGCLPHVPINTHIHWHIPSFILFGVQVCMVCVSAPLLKTNRGLSYRQGTVVKASPQHCHQYKQNQWESSRWAAISELCLCWACSWLGGLCSSPSTPSG